MRQQGSIEVLTAEYSDYITHLSMIPIAFNMSCNAICGLNRQVVRPFTHTYLWFVVSVMLQSGDSIVPEAQCGPFRSDCMGGMMHEDSSTQGSACDVLRADLDGDRCPVDQQSIFCVLVGEIAKY